MAEGLARRGRKTVDVTAAAVLARRSVAPIIALIAIAIFINYIDRGNLSIAAPLIKTELHISATQLGFLDA